MNWNQFLKPDRRKITLTAIFYIIFIFFGLIISSGFMPYVKCPNGYTETFDVFTSRIICFREDLLPIYGIFLLVLAPIIWFYIFSCIIFWIYDNFRKKNKK